jgi:hypothetical protein
VAVDSIGAWEVTNVRNGGITRVAPGRALAAPSSVSFRLAGAGPFVFAIPSGLSDKAVLRVVDAWGRTVWSARVGVSGGAPDGAVRWNGLASNGRKVAPGMYVARFEGFRAAY